MGRKLKWVLGGLVLVVLAVVGAGYFFFAPPDMPITVDDPGEGGQRVVLNDRPANFFPAPGAGPHPAIILLGGSEGGLQEGINARARLLQAEGYSVLYPGYYRTSEATKTFDMVPLETFDAALRYLQAREDIDTDRIGLVGGSKGAEGALLFASMRPEIRAVVASMPSSVVWQGFDWSATDFSQFSSSWSIEGTPVAYLPYDMPEWWEWFTGMTIAGMYEQSLAGLDGHADAAIAVEKVAGPVLLICGEQDQLWPSCPMARQLEARSRERGGPPVEVLAYAGAGHAVAGVPREETDENFEELASMGGSAVANNEARKDNWPKTLAFLRQHLGAGEAAH